MYDNPEGTNPFPAAQGMPTPFWAGQKFVPNWTATVVSGAALALSPLPPSVTWTWTWTSPVFDLRPDLRSSNGGPKDGVPMWSRAAGRLYLQMTRSSAGRGQIYPYNSPTSEGYNFSLSAKAQDFTNPSINEAQTKAPSDGITGGAGLVGGVVNDVSAIFNAPDLTANCVLATFSPPGTSLGGGDGYPVRFWRLQIVFKARIEFQLPTPDPIPAAPNLILQASMY